MAYHLSLIAFQEATGFLFTKRIALYECTNTATTPRQTFISTKELETKTSNSKS